MKSNTTAVAYHLKKSYSDMLEQKKFPAKLASSPADVVNTEVFQPTVEVKLVRTEESLERAVDVRRASYGRHTPEMEALLRVPERLDLAPEAVVFVATDSNTGRTLGSMRVLTNVNGPLEFETSVELPERYRNSNISLVQRLSIVAGPNGLYAKKALFKAFYLYSLAMQIEWMFLYTPPPRDKLFFRLGFAPVLNGESVIAGAFSDGRAVRLLALRVWDVEPLWRNEIPEWHQFFFKQYTPGIKIFSSVSNWTKSFRQPVAGDGPILS